MIETHPDRDSYEKIWTDLIDSEIKNYQSKYGEYIKLIPNIKEEIWEKYNALNRYCKNTYMKSTEGKIDRHKVAACYLIAISTVKPMRFVGNIDVDDKCVYFALNEMLAITVALSVLRAFVIAAANRKENIEGKEEILVAFENGIKLPDKHYVNHGEYISNFASEIYFSIEEGNISILSIAHELFLLEVITRMTRL